jgi:DNA-binding MarR family transcriptional regulator
MDDDGAIRLRRVIGKIARQLNSSSTGAGLNPTMLSRVIGRLQELELISRIPDPADLRSASVASTAAGQQVDQEIKARRAAAVAKNLEQLTDAQVRALTEALPALEALAEAMRQPQG